MSLRGLPKEFIIEKCVDTQVSQNTLILEALPVGKEIGPNPVLVSVLSSEAKPGMWEWAFAKGGTEVLPSVLLACGKLTIVMDKSPGQPGPLSILPTPGCSVCWGALARNDPLWLPFGAPLPAPPGYTLCPSIRAFFLGLGFTFLYQVADQLVPVPNQVFWLLPETNQLQSRKSCPSPKSGKPQRKREMKQKGKQRRREREKRSKRKKEINKKKSNLVETSR